MTPPGVEQSQTRVDPRPARGPTEVNPTMTPPGVEQCKPAGGSVRLRSALSESDDDAPGR